MCFVNVGSWKEGKKWARMSDSSKDPAIKLFGKTIQLPEIPASTAPATEGSCPDDAPGDDSSARHGSGSGNDPAEDGGGGGEEDEHLQKVWIWLVLTTTHCRALEFL